MIGSPVDIALPSPTMCASCVAQGVLYAGTAAGGLRLMAVRATMRRANGTLPSVADLGDRDEPADARR